MGTTSSRALSVAVVVSLIACSALTAQAYYIEITEPVEGATYAPCGPDTIFWNSDIPASPGSPDNLRLSWRPQGGEWEVFANDNNDGAHPWPTPPCFLGWYDVRVLYTEDLSVGDTVGFFVDGTPPPPPPPFYIEITVPEPRGYYCAPDVIEWESDIDPGAGEVIHVRYKHELWAEWVSLGYTSNDGNQPWPSAPCYTPDWWGTTERRVRVEYTEDLSVYDEVILWLTDAGFPPVDGPYGIFIDFAGDAQDFSEVTTRIDPPQYTPVEAYVALFGSEDFTTVSFALEIVPNGVFTPPDFECLLPGGLHIGPWETGVTVASTECMEPGQVVYLARLDMFYLTGSADIVIRDHDTYPRWVVDCDDYYTYYEVASHGGVWKDPMSTPVEAMSWGAIKAMYRD